MLVRSDFPFKGALIYSILQERDCYSLSSSFCKDDMIVILHHSKIGKISRVLVRSKFSQFDIDLHEGYHDNNLLELFKEDNFNFDIDRTEAILRYGMSNVDDKEYSQAFDLILENLKERNLVR